MSTNGLSSLNSSYISNIKSPAAPVSTSETPDTHVQKEDGDKKLKKALAGLGIAGAATLLGIGIYYAARGKGKTPKITPKTSDVSKAADASIQTSVPTVTQKPQVQPPAPEVKQKPQPAQPPVKQSIQPSNPEPKKVQPAAPPVKQPDLPKNTLHIERIGNGRIRVSKTSGNVTHKPVEMPEFLYHITSKTAMDKIESSGTLNISENEQLRGLYLLDSKNFLSRYGNTNVNGQNKDLLTALFRQANRGNKGIPAAQQEFVVIKIPTEDLIKNGKLRVRTQEDFFTFTDILKKINNKTGKKFILRDLCDDSKRDEFEKLVLSNGLMEKSELERFMRDMKVKIHYGHSIPSAAAHKLEDKYSIEYIFNHNINLSEFPNIETKTIKLTDYRAKNGKGMDTNKVNKLFESGFSPLQSAKAA